jgi:hypothetical protein
MIRKIVLGLLFASVSGALIYGGIYRTAARLETGNKGSESGQRQNASRIEQEARLQGFIRNESKSRENGNQGGGNRRSEITGDQLPAEVEEIGLAGTVADFSTDYLSVKMVDGQDVLIENRAWWYAQQVGFLVDIGDQVNLSGFNDVDGTFEVSQIINLTKEITVDIRDDSGRPYWAGGGGGRGQDGRSG